LNGTTAEGGPLCNHASVTHLECVLAFARREAAARSLQLSLRQADADALPFASSLLTRLVCEVPPPPLPPSKKRFFPAAGGMRSHSIRSSWRRASRERWSSSILDKIRHQSSYFGTAPSISPTLPRSGAVSRIAFRSGLMCEPLHTSSYFGLSRCPEAGSGPLLSLDSSVGGKSGRRQR